MTNWCFMHQYLNTEKNQSTRWDKAVLAAMRCHVCRPEWVLECWRSVSQHEKHKVLAGVCGNQARILQSNCDHLTREKVRWSLAARNELAPRGSSSTAHTKSKGCTSFTFDQSCGLTDLVVSKDALVALLVLLYLYRLTGDTYWKSTVKVPLSWGCCLFSNKYPCLSLSASFSGLLLLAFAIAAAISGIVILLLIIASCRRCKRRRQRELEGNEEAPRKERKDPTAW